MSLLCFYAVPKRVGNTAIGSPSASVFTSASRERNLLECVQPPRGPMTLYTPWALYPDNNPAISRSPHLMASS